jgi:hypothetical protein
MSEINVNTGGAPTVVTSIPFTTPPPSSAPTTFAPSDADNGQTDLTYTDSSGKLAVLSTGGNLTLYNVSGSCTITPKQTITSP